MNIEKAEKRDKKKHKQKTGMVTDSKSVFVIQSAMIKRAEKSKAKKNKRNKKK